MWTHRSLICALALLITGAGCGANLPSADHASGADAASGVAVYVRPADTTSILKRDTKDIVIGSTVDARNGDRGPRSLYVVPCNCSGVLKQGQLVTCNFDNKAGTAGDGTTIEVLDPTSKSKPGRWYVDR